MLEGIEMPGYVPLSRWAIQDNQYLREIQNPAGQWAKLAISKLTYKY